MTLIIKIIATIILTFNSILIGFMTAKYPYWHKYAKWEKYFAYAISLTLLGLNIIVWFK